MEVSGQYQASAALTPGIHWIGIWVSLRAGLDAVEKRKISHRRKLNPGPPARNRRYTD
jgi:hypothetical protein